MKPIASMAGTDPVDFAPAGSCTRPLLRPAVRVLIAVLSVTPFAAPAADCVIDTSGAAIAFGVYDPLSTVPATGVGTIVVSCGPPGNNLPVTFSLGTGGSGSYFPRRMSSGSNRLDYNLYTSANGNIVFGNGLGGTQSALRITSATGGATFKTSAQIFGVIPAQQDAAFGQYSDTIQVTVTF